MKGDSKAIWAIAALVVACTLWGMTFALGKIALSGLPVSQLVLYRFAIASMLLLPVAIRRGVFPRRQDLPTFLLAAFFGVPATFFLQVGGLARTSSVQASLIVGSIPLLLALAAILFDGERLTRLSWIAVGLSTAGVVLVVGLPGGESGDWLGNWMILLSLVAAVIWVLLRACAIITSHFRIPSSAHLRPVLNREFLKIARYSSGFAQSIETSMDQIWARTLRTYCCASPK